MIAFEKYTLNNGLRVILHHDETTPMAVVNILYDVGARDEDPEKTGFAHLFEHLMFGGSVHIPDFDSPLQRAGGESNAFTSNDITNYYDVLPASNLETALWLESDRMLSLAFTPKSLETQRSVVIEEFKQRYLNQPYGDVWLELRPLVYEKHPYQWATIGKEIKHIEDATMEDVRAFFKQHYHPGNAILCIAGNFDREAIKALIEKWFGDIPSVLKSKRDLPKEPEQQGIRIKQLERAVPVDAFYYAFRMPGRKSPDYHICDMLSDALGGDKSSRLYQRLKKELKLVSEINAYITGSLDDGLLMVSGKLSQGISFEALDEALWQSIEELLETGIAAAEMHRLKNKILTAKEFQEQGLLNRAMNLCYHELLGDADGINHEREAYARISPEQFQTIAKQLLKRDSCTILHIKAVNP